MPVYNVFWKAIQPNGSSNSDGKTITASGVSEAKATCKAEAQSRWPKATIVITDVKER